MRTLSRIFALVVLVGIVIVVVVGCCEYAFVAPGTIVPGTRSFAFADIGGKERRPPYVEWKDDGAKFKQALKQVRGHNGEYCICVLEKSRAEPHQYPNSKCTGRYTCPPENSPPENIRTVKVTKSKAADNIAAAESAVNDPNVTYRVQSPDPGDIAAVLDALKK